MASKLGLVFMGKQGDFVTPLTAKIVVVGNCEIGLKGEHFLSVECVTAKELESEAEKLKAQLDEIICTAKKLFQKRRITSLT